jgi:hypothetical protein
MQRPIIIPLTISFLSSCFMTFPAILAVMFWSLTDILVGFWKVYYFAR